MEHLCEVKKALISKVYEQLDCLDCINAEEMSEVVDMIKDIEQIMYYHTIIEAMHKKGKEADEEVEKHLNAHIEGM